MRYIGKLGTIYLYKSLLNVDFITNSLFGKLVTKRRMKNDEEKIDFFANSVE